jgi:hypothetical protein
MDAVPLLEAALAHQSGAASLDSTPGPGVFAAVETAKGIVIRRVAGVSGNGQLDPGETYKDNDRNGAFSPGDVDEGPISQFEPDSRVANAVHVGQAKVVHLAYVAYSETSQAKGVFSNELFFNQADGAVGITVSSASPVLAIGQDIAGLGTLTDVAIHGAVNRDGRIAIWTASASGGPMLPTWLLTACMTSRSVKMH